MGSRSSIFMYPCWAHLHGWDVTAFPEAPSTEVQNDEVLALFFVCHLYWMLGPRRASASSACVYADYSHDHDLVLGP